MIISPEKMVFEDSTDVIDYVSKGMVPTRKNFEKVMLRVRCPDSVKRNDEVYIPNHIFINCDNDTMYKCLDRVYKNRVRNRNITLGIVGIVAAALLIGKVSDSKKEKVESTDTIYVEEF